MEEKHQRGDSKTKRNEDGWRWRRLKRIGNDGFEKFIQFVVSKYTNDDVAPLKNVARARLN